MKRVLKREYVIPVFVQTLNPEQYLYFQSNRLDFLTMLNEQTIGFWLRYVITLRSALYNVGLIPRKDWRAMFCEEAFIDMIEFVAEYDVQKAHAARNHCWIKPGLDRIFGNSDDLPEKFVTFFLWTRFAGGLIEIHKCWTKAEPVRSVSDMPWKVSAQWYHHSKYHRANLFESHLKKKFGSELLQLVGFQSVIAWWEDVEVISSMKIRLLSSVYTLQIWSDDCSKIEPILSDDEDDDDEVYVGGGCGASGGISGCCGSGCSSDGDKMVKHCPLKFLPFRKSEMLQHNIERLHKCAQ